MRFLAPLRARYFCPFFNSTVGKSYMIGVFMGKGNVKKGTSKAILLTRQTFEATSFITTLEGFSLFRSFDNDLSQIGLI